MFTGSLYIYDHLQGIKSIARWLLSFQGGIHFRKLTLTWHKAEDIPLTTALVEECSHTLESLDITSSLVRPFGICVRTENLYPFPVESVSAPVDLSKAKRLKDVTFHLNSQSVNWITTGL